MVHTPYWDYTRRGYMTPILCFTRSLREGLKVLGGLRDFASRLRSGPHGASYEWALRGFLCLLMGADGDTKWTY